MLIALDCTRLHLIALSWRAPGVHTGVRDHRELLAEVASAGGVPAVLLQEGPLPEGSSPDGNQWHSMALNGNQWQEGPLPDGSSPDGRPLVRVDWRGEATRDAGQSTETVLVTFERRRLIVGYGAGAQEDYGDSGGDHGEASTTGSSQPLLRSFDRSQFCASEPQSVMALLLLATMLYALWLCLHRLASWLRRQLGRTLITTLIRPSSSTNLDSSTTLRDARSPDASDDSLPVHEVELSGSRQLLSAAEGEHSPRVQERVPPAPSPPPSLLAWGETLYWAALCVIAEVALISVRRPAGGPAGSENLDLFFLAMAGLFLISWRHRRREGSAGEGSPTDNALPVPCNRAQTEEWKGWMQAAFVLYHYTNAQSLLGPVRVFVTSYVWMTGFGHGVSLWATSAKFTGTRLVEMLWRMNYLALLLSAATGTEWVLYYVVVLHSTHFLMIFATLLLAKRIAGRRELQAASAREQALGLALYALLIALVWEVPGVYEASVGPLLRGAFGAFFDEYFHYRTLMDAWSSFAGLLFAVAYPHVLSHRRLLFDVSGKLFWRMMAVAVALFTVWAVVWLRLWSDPDAYIRYHRFVGTLPIPLYLLVRNAGALPRYRLHTLEAIGKVSLEAYLLQFHLFLGRHAREILVLIPRAPLLNMVVCGTIYLFGAQRCFALTAATRHAVVSAGYKPAALLILALLSSTLLVVASMLVRDPSAPTCLSWQRMLLLSALLSCWLGLCPLLARRWSAPHPNVYTLCPASEHAGLIPPPPLSSASESWSLVLLPGLVISVAAFVAVLLDPCQRDVHACVNPHRLPPQPPLQTPFQPPPPPLPPSPAFPPPPAFPPAMPIDEPQLPPPPPSSPPSTLADGSLVRWPGCSSPSDETPLAATGSESDAPPVPAARILRNRHIMFVGDSVTRYQYVELAFSLAYGQHLTVGESPNPVREGDFATCARARLERLFRRALCALSAHSRRRTTRVVQVAWRQWLLPEGQPASRRGPCRPERHHLRQLAPPFRALRLLPIERGTHIHRKRDHGRGEPLLPAPTALPARLLRAVVWRLQERRRLGTRLQQPSLPDQSSFPASPVAPGRSARPSGRPAAYLEVRYH